MNTVKRQLKSQITSLLKYPVPLSPEEFNARRYGKKVFINSLPKSGTFLLRRLLSLCPNFSSRWSHHGFVAKTPNLLEKLGNLHQGQYVSGHLYWNSELVEVLRSTDVLTLFIIRDPRDVAVSLANYLTYKNKNHRLHPYYQSLSSDEERLMAAITGLDNALLADGIVDESIGEEVESYLPWLKEPTCLSVRFEDLIGSGGGGDDAAQFTAVCSIIEYLGLDLSKQEIERISQSLFFKDSTTFRKGQIGDWRNHFSEAHKRAFKAVAARSLSELGYEKDDDW